MVHRRIIVRSTETSIEQMKIDLDIDGCFSRICQDDSLDIVHAVPEYDTFGLKIIFYNKKKTKRKVACVKLPRIGCTGDWVKYAIIQVKAQCEMYGYIYEEIGINYETRNTKTND